MRNLECTIYSVSTISSVIASSSPKCLHWTADGQLCFITKNAVYVLTPDHGINFDTESSLSKRSWHLGWFKTMIETDKITPTKWTDYSQSWATVSLGALDDAIVSVATSPTDLTKYGGCVVATLSANMDVVLWMAGKNFIKGEWAKISEVISSILRKIDPAKSLLQAQITSIEWTAQADFGLSSPGPRLDGSLLILGSRAGFITLMRYHPPDSIQYLQTLSVSDQWITRLTFDSWNSLTPGRSEGTLAYGASDGSVGLIKISQRLIELGGQAFTPQYDIQLAMESNPRLVYQGGGSAGSVLKWIPIPGRTSILVSCHPGTLKLFSQSEGSPTTYWTGFRLIRLTTQKTSRHSSALHPSSGVTYLPKYDALVVTLSDGSFHVVQNLSNEPDVADSSSSMALGDNFKEWINSEALSYTARMTSQRAAKGNMDKDDVYGIHGSVSYDESASFLWAYEPFNPSDFSYKQDSQHSSTLVVSQLWNEDASCGLFENLALTLASAKTCWGLSPLHVLRPYLLHLGDSKRLKECHGQLLDTLRLISTDDCSKQVIITSWGSGDVSVELREKFRISLATHLYGWDEFLSLRMRLVLADFAWKSSENEEIQTNCGVVAESILNAISNRISRILIRHLTAVVGLLDSTDLPIAFRRFVQCTLPGIEPDLGREAGELWALLKPALGSTTAGGPQTMANALDEICPACGVTIPFEDVKSARCTNGHSWPRCSVTCFVLATCWVRTCIGCCRKAFLPPLVLDKNQGQELPEIARSWVVEELLNAVTKCLFCGNGFVSIL